MPLPPTLKRLAVLSVLPLALLSTGCASDRLEIVKPPVERVSAVAAPVIPEPATPCTYDPSALCLTDKQTAGVIEGYDAALAEANRKLAWIRDWLAGVE